MKLKITLALAAAVAFLAVTKYAAIRSEHILEQQKPGHTSTETQNSGRNDQESNTAGNFTAFFLPSFREPVPVIIEQITNEKTEAESQCAEEEGIAEKFWFGLCLINRYFSSETTIALFTVILAVVTAFLWDATRKLVSSAEKTAQRQLRAYVFIESSEIVISESGEMVEIKIKFRNSGQTPAFSACTNIEAAFFKADKVAEFKEVVIQKRIPLSIPPQQPIYRLKKLATVPPHVQAGFLGGHSKLFCWGRIEYIDCFGNPQYTEFRYFHLGGQEFNPNRIEYCHEGNKAT